MKSFAPLLTLCLGLLAAPLGLAAEREDTPPNRPTVQKRFGTKEGHVTMHLVGVTHVRNDLYNTLGAGLDLGYYFNEQLGAELRLVWLYTRLSGAGDSIRERAGLTPDARAQNYLTTAGLRYSFGYGKILAFDTFVVHFDPQITLHAGTAFAGQRVLPTVLTGLSLLNHFKWGIQVKLDLNLTAQMERRDRGWVPSFGFAPFLGLGWSYGGLAAVPEAGP
ncbi:MAG: hypothetical protein H0U74_17230 [Bradymonadaceae bacterium]|nr:hypothetical protein [Lujinxingiaceae bacterium]